MRDGCRYHIKVEYMDGNGKNTKQNSGQKIKQSARRRNPNLRLVKNGDKLVKEENSSKGARGSFGEKEAGETKKAVQKGRKELEEAKKGAQQEKAEAKPEKKAGEKKGTGETKKSTRKRKRVSGEKKKKTAEGQKSAEGKVRRSGKTVTLEPMNPYERRVIHSALQNDRYVETHSEGQEPFRRVVVTLKEGVKVRENNNNRHRRYGNNRNYNHNRNRNKKDGGRE